MTIYIGCRFYLVLEPCAFSGNRFNFGYQLFLFPGRNGSSDVARSLKSFHVFSFFRSDKWMHSLGLLKGFHMESINVDDLKKYILTDFRDEKHKYASLMDIFRNDYPYFKELKKNHKICPDVLQFFSKCKGQLNAAESIRVDAFRNLRYEQIIKDYVEDLDRKSVV